MSTQAAAMTRRHRPSAPVDLDLVLPPSSGGRATPRAGSAGTAGGSARTTPDGPVMLHLVDEGGEAAASAWGEGAGWMLERVPDLLGARDDASGFRPHHDVVARGWPRLSRWRVPANGLVAQMLVCSVPEQRVTGREAFSSQRQLVRRFGTPAPGAGEALGPGLPSERRRLGADPLVGPAAGRRRRSPLARRRPRHARGRTPRRVRRPAP
uniref:Uncharacterized protein n=1 Tax=Janibacter limosus TaxID=53458 RepID=A0AC61U1Y9_9MICO|nr:hypothetical protein [Janibacter limosus]